MADRLRRAPRPDGGPGAGPPLGKEWWAETDELIGQLGGLRAAMSEDRRAAEATVRAQRAEIERMRRADELAAGARAGELRRMGARLEEARPAERERGGLSEGTFAFRGLAGASALIDRDMSRQLRMPGNDLLDDGVQSAVRMARLAAAARSQSAGSL